VGASESSCTHVFPAYKRHALECATGKAFSAEDQKQAGCTGNDTVNHCSIKLFWYCMKERNPSFPASKAKMLTKIEVLEKALKEYAAQLKQIPTK
jgi:hypothetical protein